MRKINDEKVRAGKLLAVVLLLPAINVDQADPRSIADQFMCSVKAEFAHDTGTVVLNRFRADEKLISNLFIREPLGQHSHDFLFS